MMTYTNHGMTSSAKRNSRWKPKLSERDCRTLKRIVCINHRSTAAKVTAELHIHFENHFYKKAVWRELHKSNIHDTAAIAKPLIIENGTRRWRKWCDDHKTWPSDDWKYIWPDESSFMLCPTSGRVYVWTSPRKPECLVPTVKHGNRSVMIWAAVSNILLVLYLLWVVKLLPVTMWIF